MHSSLLLLEPLDAIVSIQDEQTQTTLITNLTCQTWKRIAPLSVHQVWLSRHTKGIRNRRLSPSTCSKSKSSSTGYSYRHGRRTTDLKVWRFYCYHLQNKLILQQEVPAGVFWWNSKEQSHLQLQKLFIKSFTILNPSSGNSHLSNPVAV